MLRALAALLLLSTPAAADTALAAVAANFAGATEALAAAFKAETGHQIDVTVGSTGKLYAQINEGAPYDLMLSADSATPERLASEGHGTPFPYALGVLTFWAPGAEADAEPQAVLQDPATLHVAIANPDLAPYGKASVAALEAMVLYDSLKDKIVMGQNIGQTYALVESGAAEAGFVAGSAVAKDARGLVWNVSPDLYPPIQQDAILLQHGADNAAAKGFLAYLTSAPAKAIIAGFGYGIPE